MKPDWKDAPEWANWLAMDGDGEWWWHHEEPHYDEYDEWFTREDSIVQFAGRMVISPYESLEARPSAPQHE